MIGRGRDPCEFKPMFARFERLLKPAIAPDAPEPPAGLVAFYWHFARQAKPLFAALFVAGFIVAIMDTMIPIFIGRIVTLVTSSAPATLFAEHGHLLIGMALVLLVLRPAALTTQNLLANQAIAANVSNRIRWQNHWHVVRQSWAFFQNDFAGRIANRVMQTGPAIRETVVALITGVWYILVYGISALLLLASADPWLSLPTGRIVDSYTNILTVKLFARAREEDAYVREALEQHTRRFHRSLRLNTLFSFSLSTLNAMLVTGTGGLAVLLWTQGRVEVGTVAMALPLAWQIVSVSGWIAYQVTTIFENVGVVQEGMMTIARPIQLIDAPGAPDLAVSRGEIAFKDVRFGYGRETVVDEDGRERSFAVIEDLSLTVKPGEKVGLVGRSGAGKSTLVNVLLRFFDVEDGRI